MKFSLVAAILLCVPFTHPFEDEDFEEDVDFGDRMDQLKEICAEEGFMQFNKFYFEDYLKWSSRNYSFLLLFVALADQRCANCRQALEEFTILAKSYRRAPEDRLFLGVVDYDQTPEIFVRLFVQSIPAVALVTADYKLTAGKAVPQMDLQRFGFAAEAIGEWLAVKADLHVEIVRPPDYTPFYVAMVSVSIAAPLVVWLWTKRVLKAAFWSSTVTGLAAMLFCLLMVSGHMFNQIHRTPAFHISEQGISVMSRESTYQYTYETYLIGAMHLGFGGCVIAVVERVKSKSVQGNKKSMSNVRLVAALLFAALFYSCIVSSFRFKMNVYPYTGLVNIDEYF